MTGRKQGERQETGDGEETGWQTGDGVTDRRRGDRQETG